MDVQAATAFGRSRALRGAAAAGPSTDPSAADSGARQAGGPPIDCIRALMAADVIDDAERRAAALGIGADRVLIAAGKLSEETYLRALGESLGVIFEPRTKPKALNVALPFVRGIFTVIYDAEDRPDFEPAAPGPAGVPCRRRRSRLAQARLCIDNSADSWLACGIMAQTPQDF